MFEQVYDYTLEQYRKIVELDPEHKYEYVDGHIRMMSRGTPAHGQIAGNILTTLNNALRESECNVYNSDVTVHLEMEERTYDYIPDVTVGCDPHDWTRKDALISPTVVVEVLSPSTAHIDKNEKLAVYQRYPVILEILLVDSRKRYVEHYHRITQNKWEVAYYKHEEDCVELSHIEVSLPLRDIY